MKKIINLLSVLFCIGFCAFIVFGLAFVAKDVGLNPNFCLSLTILFSIPTIASFVWFLFCTIVKPKRKKQITADLIFYNKKTYPIYLEVRNCFRIALRNKILTRTDILEFKELLNKSLEGNLKQYQSYKFKNDAHEIYTKLKSHHITENDMTALKDYIEPYAICATVYNLKTTTTTTKKPYLRVVK